MTSHLSVHPVDLQLRDPFGIARSTVSVREVVLVRIGMGWGEASPNPYYGEDRPKVLEAIRGWERYLPTDTTDLLAVEDILDRIEKNHPAPGLQCAKAAFDIALHDHLARIVGVPLYRIFGRAPRPDQPLVTSFTIGISDYEDMLRKAEEARLFRVIKIKTGRDLDHDIRFLTELRRRMPDHVLRVDANAGYTLDQARKAARVFADLGIEYLEQPLAKGNLNELEILHRDSPIPIYVDEDSVISADLPRLVGKVDGINIKLMKSGGLAEARRMLALARVYGFRVMIGCMIETSVGIAAAAALGPFADNLDLDGSLLISNDPFRGLEISPEGIITLSNEPGLGLTGCPS
jgi:L-alanine-DL-glutamate epimerase-like enolase superfamily enzyme